MFAHIRRHQKWLWIFISAAVIISFVWYFNPNQQMGGGGGDSQSVVGSMYGEPIKMSHYNDARAEALLHYYFSNGNWPENDEFSRQMKPVEREARNRLFLTRKLKDFDIKVDDKAAADWIMTAFRDPQTKQYQYQFVQRFLENIRSRGLSEQDFERYVRHQVGIQHLAAVAGASGKLVPPQEAERVLREERERIDTKVVLFSLSNYVAKVQATTEAIGTYYTNASARYALPERVQLTYVAFPASNYLAQADQTLSKETNFTQQVDAIYQQRGAQFYTDLDGNPMTPEAAKQRIRDEIQKSFALREANKAAYEFAADLDKVQVNPANPNPAEPLENLAGTKGLAAQVTEPFSQFQGPQNLNVPNQFTQVAFQLTPQEPIVQEPIAGEDAVYVISFKRRLPREVQSLETVQAQVTEDYKRNEGMKLAREAALAFVTAATNALAGGGQLEAVAQQLGLTVTDVPPILRQQSRESTEALPAGVEAGSLRSAVSDLSEGQLSSYSPTREGGFVALAEKVLPPTEEEVKKDLPQFAQDFRRRNAAESFSAWFGKEMQLAQLSIPGDGLERDEIQ